MRSESSKAKCMELGFQTGNFEMNLCILQVEALNPFSFLNIIVD